MPLPQRTNDPIISIRSLDWCYTPLPFTLSFSLSLTCNRFPKSHLDGVYVPPQVQYSMFKDGEEAALMVAAEEGRRRRRILLEHNKHRERGLNEARPLEPL